MPYVYILLTLLQILIQNKCFMSVTNAFMILLYSSLLREATGPVSAKI